MRKFPFLAGLLALASLAPAGALQAGQSVQQQFDSASDALIAERWEEALRGFETLEARIENSNNPRSLAIVRVRKAAALLKLGRREEAAAALRLGLPELPADDESLNEDRFLGLLTLGELAEISLDYAEALRHYRAAAAIELPPVVKLRVYRGLIQTQIFSHPRSALAAADEGLALAAGAGAGDPTEALLRTLRGRVLLNQGRHEEARDELGAAMRLLGGLTMRVGLNDIVARHDLALAALLAGNAQDARRLLAYTGAGQFETQLSPASGRLVPPPCGDGLEPSDIAVVEYSISDDGTVGRVTPIYASRPGATALKFAEAVRGWGWNPDSFGAMPPLLRAAMRVELRCARSRTEGSPDERIEETRRWAAERGIDWPEDGRFPVRPVATIRAELTREENASPPDPMRLLRPLIELARHPGIDDAETTALLRRALPIAGAQQAPPGLVAGLADSLVAAQHRAAEESRRARVPDYAPMLEYPAIRDNPRAVAELRLEQARAFFSADEMERASEFASLALSTPGLPAGGPLRARIRNFQGGLAAERGDMEEAAAAFAEAGSAVDVCEAPRTYRHGHRAIDFPDTAMRWGFEGWVKVELIVLPDGTPSRPRSVMAYPPFVFDEAAEGVAQRTRFDPLPVPQTAECPKNITIQFRIES